MRLLALLAAVAAGLAALFFLVTALLWFGQGDGGRAASAHGLHAFAWVFLSAAFGLFVLDHAGVGVASRAGMEQPEPAPRFDRPIH